MIELDGVQYNIKTPEENASDLVAFINDYCQTHQIKNSQGEVIYIDANEANPLYMMCFGNAYLTTVLQKLIYSAGCSMDVASSSERQLLNIADIAGINRRAATKTTIQGTVYSDESGPCEISRELTATVTAGTYSLVFHPAFDIEVPANSARQIVFVCEDYGAYNITENTIIEFDEIVPHFRQMTTLASIPGQDQESIASLRARLQRRAIEGTQADRAAEAIQSLDGVSLCAIYYNDSAIASTTVGSRGLVVPPREALLMVQGYNDNIAKVFYQNMICKTAGEDFPSSVGAYSQDYVTRAGQHMPVWIVPPVQSPIYIKIYVYEYLTYAQIQGIKDVISSLSSSLTIGQMISSKEVTDIVAANYADLTIQGASVSADGVHYSYNASPNYDAVFTFNLDNIEVVEAITA